MGVFISWEMVMLAQVYEKLHEERGCYGRAVGPERGRLFRDWIGTQRHVLDLGCRDGTLTRYYLAGNWVVGLDIDRRALALAARWGMETRWADFNERLPFDDASFGAVVAGEVIEHALFPAQLVAEIARVLRPGGLFVGSVPNVYRLKNRLRFLVGCQIEDDAVHLHQFSLGALRALLAEHFVVVDLMAVNSRFLWLSPWLFGHELVWRGERKC